MNQDRQGAGGQRRTPRSFVGSAWGKWEARFQSLFTDLSERGETRVEEWSRRLKQTDLWLRTLEAQERVTSGVERVTARWDRLSEATWSKAGVATGQQLEELAEQLRQLQWRVDRLAQKVQDSQPGTATGKDGEDDVRSLA